MKPTRPNYRKLNEVYKFTHNDISVYVSIDYYNNKISLVENNGDRKNWLFANRGVEYMNGWLNIFEAQAEAIKDAKQRYEHELAETSKFSEEFINRVLNK